MTRISNEEIAHNIVKFMSRCAANKSEMPSADKQPEHYLAELIGKSASVEKLIGAKGHRSNHLIAAAAANLVDPVCSVMAEQSEDTQLFMSASNIVVGKRLAGIIGGWLDFDEGKEEFTAESLGDAKNKAIACSFATMAFISALTDYADALIIYMTCAGQNLPVPGGPIGRSEACDAEYMNLQAAARAVEVAANSMELNCS